MEIDTNNITTPRMTKEKEDKGQEFYSIIEDLKIKYQDEYSTFERLEELYDKMKDAIIKIVAGMQYIIMKEFSQEIFRKKGLEKLAEKYDEIKESKKPVVNTSEKSDISTIGI